MVIGTGRSGTSFVAEILQNHFEFCIAHSYQEPYPPSPLGNFEERALMTPSKLLAAGEIEASDWLSYYSELRQDCQWHGAKLPRLAMCTREQWNELNPRLVIRTHRVIDAVTKSMKRWRGETVAYWKEFVVEREAKMDEGLKDLPVADVWFTQSITSREDMIGWLEPQVEKLWRTKNADL